MSSSRLRSSAVSLIGRFMVPFSRAREQTDRRGLGHEGAKARQAPEGAADAPLASCCKILNADRRAGADAAAPPPVSRNSLLLGGVGRPTATRGGGRFHEVIDDLEKSVFARAGDDVAVGADAPGPCSVLTLPVLRVGKDLRAAKRW